MKLRTALLCEERVTSRQLVTQYLTRIALYEDKLHAVITVNPKASEEADPHQTAASAADGTVTDISVRTPAV